MTADTVAPAPSSHRFAARLFGVGLVVFLANAGLLVLQLVAGRLLSPFIGSALETWTSVIAAFLTGIALGNLLGGRAAERAPSARKLAAVLLLGVVGTLWMAALPMLLTGTGWHTALPLGVRTPVLAFLLCLPVATVLSLLTPLAIRIGVPDVGHTGRVAGTIFALSSLGCLLGNYATGFVLIPEFTINGIVYAVAALLAAVAVGAVLFGGAAPTAAEREPAHAPQAMRAPQLHIALGFAVVFLCSFGGMALELAASRVIALQAGVSLYTWTGVIGVMLAGTCLGNWLGGKVADRVHRGGSAERPTFALAACLLAAAVSAVLAIVLFTVASSSTVFDGLGPISTVLALTFALFFLPMFLLGTISPQVIRLCVRDVRTAGRTAGQIYAVSTAGAIVGTLATGYWMIAAVGFLGAIFVAAVLPCVAATLLVRVWRQPAMLYVMSAVGGAFLGGTVLIYRGGGRQTAESNYYTINVTIRAKHVGSVSTPLAAAVGAGVPRYEPFAMLALDQLQHSEVNLADPTYFKYRHEQVQLEAIYLAAERRPAAQRVLVIGGGGYTLPRATRTLVPSAAVDVVEIDPGVTKVAYSHLGLDHKLDIKSYHQDGRQFVAERAEAHAYDVVTLDAVNDLSVPPHLLTKECNDAVKRTLAADGEYLVTVIDNVGDGKLWKAAFHTLRRSYKHVDLALPAAEVLSEVEVNRYLHWQAVTAKPEDRPTEPALSRLQEATTVEGTLLQMSRKVVVIRASDVPFDGKALDAAVLKRSGKESDTFVLSDELVGKLLATEKELVLTDQYAPVDNLMSNVFLKRERTAR